MQQIHTHHTHFGIEFVIRSEQVNFIVSSDKANVRRLALACGCEKQQIVLPVFGNPHSPLPTSEGEYLNENWETWQNEAGQQVTLLKFAPNPPQWALMCDHTFYDQNFGASFA